MEVMLERVQFKFASIIGELCSEPIVLSQFAVWVDMRLAEYKLKGSISLDCSGDSPDPIWIKGVTYALKEKLKAAEESAAKTMSGIISHRTGVGQDFETQVRSDSRGRNDSVADGPSLVDITQDLHVKPEPVDESSAFPVSLYTNNEKMNSSASPHRKRPISSSTSSQLYPSETGESMPKSSRLSVDEQDLTGTVDPDNTSLLSIIGMNDSQLDSATNNDNDDDIIECDMTSFQSPSQALGENSGRLPAAQGSSKQAWISGHASHHLHQQQRSDIVARFHSDHQIFPSSEASRQLDVQARKVKSYVKKFQIWAAATCQEMRKIETILPSELDSYLETFFSTVRCDNGSDYGYKSLITLRAGLERHLQQHDYPASLQGSALFARSRDALRRRRTQNEAVSSPDQIPQRQ